MNDIAPKTTDLEIALTVALSGNPATAFRGIEQLAAQAKRSTLEFAHWVITKVEDPQATARFRLVIAEAVWTGFLGFEASAPFYLPQFQFRTVLRQLLASLASRTPPGQQLEKLTDLLLVTFAGHPASAGEPDNRMFETWYLLAYLHENADDHRRHFGWFLEFALIGAFSTSTTPGFRERLSAGLTSRCGEIRLATLRGLIFGSIRGGGLPPESVDEICQFLGGLADPNSGVSTTPDQEAELVAALAKLSRGQDLRLKSSILAVAEGLTPRLPHRPEVQAQLIEAALLGVTSPDEVSRTIGLVIGFAKTFDLEDLAGTLAGDQAQSEWRFLTLRRLCKLTHQLLRSQESVQVLLKEVDEGVAEGDEPSLRAWALFLAGYLSAADDLKTVDNVASKLAGLLHSGSESTRLRVAMMLQANSTTDSRRRQNPAVNALALVVGLGLVESESPRARMVAVRLLTPSVLADRQLQPTVVDYLSQVAIHDLASQDPAQQLAGGSLMIALRRAFGEPAGGTPPELVEKLSALATGELSAQTLEPFLHYLGRLMGALGQARSLFARMAGVMKRAVLRLACWTSTNDVPATLWPTILELVDRAAESFVSFAQRNGEDILLGVFPGVLRLDPVLALANFHRIVKLLLRVASRFAVTVAAQPRRPISWLLNVLFLLLEKDLSPSNQQRVWECMARTLESFAAHHSPEANCLQVYQRMLLASARSVGPHSDLLPPILSCLVSLTQVTTTSVPNHTIFQVGLCADNLLSTVRQNLRTDSPDGGDLSESKKIHLLSCLANCAAACGRPTLFSQPALRETFYSGLLEIKSEASTANLVEFGAWAAAGGANTADKAELHRALETFGQARAWRETPQSWGIVARSVADLLTAAAPSDPEVWQKWLQILLDLAEKTSPGLRGPDSRLVRNDLAIAIGRLLRAGRQFVGGETFADFVTSWTVLLPITENLTTASALHSFFLDLLTEADSPIDLASVEVLRRVAVALNLLALRPHTLSARSRERVRGCLEHIQTDPLLAELYTSRVLDGAGRLHL